MIWGLETRKLTTSSRERFFACSHPSGSTVLNSARSSDLTRPTYAITLSIANSLFDSLINRHSNKALPVCSRPGGNLPA